VLHRGSVLISPDGTFSIFNNSTLYNTLASSRIGREELPTMMQDMTFQEFSKRANKTLVPGLFFPEEHYYFQGIPPKEPLQRLLRSMPLACASSGAHLPTDSWALPRYSPFNEPALPDSDY